MPGEFIQNPTWEILLLKEPEAVAMVYAEGKLVQEAIISNLPQGHGGHYAANWAGGSDVIPDFAADGTAVAKVTMGDPRWHIIEFGSAKYAGVHNPAYAPVRRGVLSTGLEWIKE
jgi:hypothetical protein